MVDDEDGPGGQPLFDEPERKPVEVGLAYLSLVIAGIVAVVGWLVWTYTGG